MSITRNHIRLSLVALCVILAGISLFGCESSTEPKKQYKLTLYWDGEVTKTIVFDEKPKSIYFNGRYHWHWRDVNDMDQYYNKTISSLEEINLVEKK